MYCEMKHIGNLRKDRLDVSFVVLSQHVAQSAHVILIGI